MNKQKSWILSLCCDNCGCEVRYDAYDYKDEAEGWWTLEHWSDEDKEYQLCSAQCVTLFPPGCVVLEEGKG